MAFQSNMGTQNPMANINTDGLALYGPQSQLRLDYYNTYLSAKIFPIKPEGERTAKSVYEYKKRTSISLNREDVFYLAWILKEEIIPKTIKNEPASIGIVSARVNLFIIGNGIKETGKINPFVTIARGLDEKRIPSEIRTFTFRPFVTIVDYDPKSGNTSALEDNRYGLVVLQGFFDHCAELSGAGAHISRYIDRYQRLHQIQFNQAAANKLGCPDYYKNAALATRGGSIQEPDWTAGSAPPIDVAPEELSGVITEDAQEPPLASVSSIEDLGSLI